MTAWGQMQVGKVLLAEAHLVSRRQHETIGTRSITVGGTEYWPGSPRLLSEADVAAVAEDILGLKDKFVPISFSSKSGNNGYYIVTDSGVEHTRWAGEAQAAVWQMDLTYQGPDAAIDVEARFSHVVRANGFALGGTRWHAPPIGHYAYYTGTTPPSGTVVRPTAYGNMTVFLSVPSGINPRWGCPVSSALLGRVTLVSAGIARAASGINVPTTTWVLDNGIVRVSPLAASGLLSIGVWNGAAYDSKAWNVQRAGASIALSTFSAATVLRNDVEAVTLRLVRDRAPGRDTVDLTLRRGSRFVEVLVQTDSSATLGVTLQSSETQTDNTASGYVVATGDDGFGDRYIAGSSKASVTAVAGGGVQKTAVTSLDFYIGVVYNGGAAISGDQATNIRDQYIGTMSAKEAGVRR